MHLHSNRKVVKLIIAVVSQTKVQLSYPQDLEYFPTIIFLSSHFLSNVPLHLRFFLSLQLRLVVVELNII